MNKEIIICFGEMNMNGMTPLIYKKPIKFYCNNKTSIRDLYKFLCSYYNVIDKDLYNEINYSKHFSFLDNYDVKQTTQLDYSLLKYLKNFSYDLKKAIYVIYEKDLMYGKTFNLGNVASIQINAREPNHGNPHVHVYSRKRKGKCYRIDLETMTQMKTDKEDWTKEFSLKCRKVILNSLKNNKDILVNLYMSYQKGLYIRTRYEVECRNGEYFIVEVKD